MNKKTKRIAGWALGLSMAVAGIGAAVGAVYVANNVSPMMVKADSPSTLTFTAACGGSGTADDGVSWTITSDGTESAFDSTKGIHYGTGSASVQYIKATTSDISGTITKVVANASTASGVSATVGVTVGGSAFGGDAQSLSSSATNYTFNGSASGEIVVTITKPSSATKAIYLKSIAVTYSASYTVTYDANGATSGTAPTDANKYTSGSSVTVKGNTGDLAKTNYNFNGWNTASDGSGTHYDAGRTFTITATTTLYAEWEDARTYCDITTPLGSHLSLTGDTHVLSGTDGASLTLVADAKWKLPSSIIVTVPSAETTLTKDEDYMYDSADGSIEFFCSIEADVLITGTATQADIIGIEVEVNASEKSFYLGHDFTHSTAIVTATYDDLAGTPEDVTAGCTWSTPDMFSTGEKTVTVTHTASNETDTYTISVSNKVLASAHYGKITSALDLTDGQYLIVYPGDTTHDSVAFNGSLSTLDAANNGLAVTISNNSIAYSDSLAAATFTYNAGDKTLRSASGYYIGKTANGNGLDSNESTKYTNTITFSDGNAVITSSGGTTLRYNYASDNLRFRYYGSGQQAVQLYKYSPAVTKDLIKISASAKSGTRYVGDSVSASDFDLTAYYDDGTNASVTPTALENATLSSTSNTVTVKYTEDGITKSAEVIVAAEVRSAELESLTWNQAGLNVFDGDAIDFSELAAVYANYDDDSSTLKAIANCEVGLYSKSGEVYTKEYDLDDGAAFDADLHDGLYLGISYTENDATVVAYASAPVNVVATINEVYAQVPTYSFNRTTEIKAGDVVTFVNENSEKVASSMGTNIINAASYDGDVTTSFTFTVGKVGDYYTFHNAGGYLGNHSTGTSGNNNAYLDDEIDTENNQNYFTVSFDGNNAVITSVYDSNRKLRFNSDRFCFYGSGQSVVQLYKGVAGYEPTGDNIANTNAVAQKAALEFAADFKTDMDCEGTNGNTVNVQTKWSALASKFSAKMNSLDGENFDNFKSLFAYAYSIEGGDELQDMLARYGYIVAKYNGPKYNYNLTDFLNTSVDRPEVSGANNVEFGLNSSFGVQNNSSIAIAIVIGASLIAATGFAFLRRKKEDR